MTGTERMVMQIVAMVCALWNGMSTNADCDTSGVEK
jgi:hypothetical protein